VVRSDLTAFILAESLEEPSMGQCARAKVPKSALTVCFSERVLRDHVFDSVDSYGKFGHAAVYFSSL
jgi:hypothetical protein